METHSVETFIETSLVETSMKTHFENTPVEISVEAHFIETIIEIPNPKGRMISFVSENLVSESAPAICCESSK